MLTTFFDDLYRLNREMNKFLGSGKRERYYATNWPEVNIYDNENEYVVVSTIPGVSKENVNISLKDNSLKISGERKINIPENANYHLRERKEGKFERNFLLNDKVDPNGITAELKNGLLLVKLQKAAETKPITIAIK
ncbi:MAG TPA: Hsp20/alpha crystallin family protein [Spirochaetota bacterium]|nr:Hsp20/alpha crystallin family protein [Spirochaetota bacterium]